MRTVFFFDDFNRYSAECLIKDLATTAKLDKDIRLVINSPGGNVTDLLAIVDSINLIDMNLETVCMGQAASCGSMLFSMGKKRYITKNARILLHQVSGGAWGDIQDMQICIEEAKRLNELTLDILSKNLGKDKEALRQDLSRDKILTAEQAVQYGIADSIISDSLFANEIQLFKKSKFEDAVKNTIQEMASDKDIKLYKIENKELFKAGTYRGKTYTEKDVEDLVKNTNYLVQNFDFKIPLKLGHDNDPELGKAFKDMLQSDSMPAFGHVENIRYENVSAVGDFNNIPEPIYNLIDKQFFCKKSPEIWNSFKIKDKNLGYVLDSIALLGAAQPEIPDLFTKNPVEDKGELKMTVQLTESEIKAKLEKEQAEEAAKKAEKEAQEKAIKDADARAATAEKAQKDAEEKLATLLEQTQKEKLEQQAVELVDKGVILPYQKETLVAVLGKLDGAAEKIKFSKNGKDDEEMELSKAFVQLLSDRPKFDPNKNYSEDSRVKNESLTQVEKEAEEALKAYGRKEDGAVA